MRLFIWINLFFIGMTLIGLWSISCQQKGFEEPQISRENYAIVDGFNLSVVASEPFLEAPVSIDFDLQGRIWVVEMIGFMRNLEGTGEEDPTGRISILEDLDQDGVVDHTKVFLDSLVLPRSLALVYGGLLYVEPPNLWFVEITNDKPGKRSMVDSIYADGGNVEHQPNGLMMNIDNWIYNANSNFRYKLKNGSWIKEPTSYRGQWGISKDNIGRLYYNTNSILLNGDLVLPNTVIRNPYFKPSESLNVLLSKSQRVFPAHPTAVNRGYRPGELDENKMLINTTSACGPLIYRGGQFPIDYSQNAFVCVPEANLIKRIKLGFESYKTEGTSAWEGKEFISSTDEGFRPVNIFNGPDGAMYIVDMHRGIIQHKAYLTQYLSEEMARKRLDTILGMGRIMRVKYIDHPVTPLPDFQKATSDQITDLLSSSNGWIRDKAQQLLIQRQDPSVLSKLKSTFHSEKSFPTQIHILHTLNELGGLSFDFLQKICVSGTNSETIAHALILMESFVDDSRLDSHMSLVNQLYTQHNELIDLYLAISLKAWIPISPDTCLSFLSNVAQRYPSQPVFQEAITSSLEGWEDKMQNRSIYSELLRANLTAVARNKQDNILNPIYVNISVGEDTRTKGLNLYRSICAACHGPTGNGIQNLAPPLKNSEYLSGPVQRLALILLHGMSGPITINGERYEFNNVMPGLIENPTISDQDIVDIISYLNNAFLQESAPISAETIQKLRAKKPTDGPFYTEESLNKLDW